MVVRYSLLRPMKNYPTKAILIASLVAVVCLFSAQRISATPPPANGPTTVGPGADESVRQDGGKKHGPKKKGKGKKKGGPKKE
jgi:hypothetical protein